MTLTVFHSGTVADADHAAGQSGPTALAVQDGIITAVGDAAMALLAGATETVDLAGGYLSASFADGHAHPLFGGLEDFGPQIRSCRSVEEIAASVRGWADANPDSGWVIGASYNATLAPGGMFDAEWLDAAVADRPVLLRSWDYHTIWVNSAALRAAGIDRNTPEPALGRIVRRPDGSPLGTLMEAGAIDLVTRVAPAFTLEQRVAALQAATAKYAAAGVTWIQDAWVELEDVPAYEAAVVSGRLDARINLAFRADPRIWNTQPEGFVAARSRIENLGSGMLTANTVKFFIDGIIESHTACMLAPYADAPAETGLANWQRDQLHEAMASFDALGFQLHLHAIGDAAVRSALDGLEEVQRRNGYRDRRPVIAHLQLVDPTDIERFAALGAVANFEPLWACSDEVMRLLTIPRLGAPRAEQQYPIASLARAGVHLSFGSDWPVTGHHPVAGLATAVTRQGGDYVAGAAWIPAERIHVETALEAYTSGVAYQAFAERHWGALRPGMSADLVLLSEDPRRVPEDGLAALEVLGTWLAGRPTFITNNADTRLAHTSPV
ncbi:amidohydrolase [Pseudarthrobacter sp. O4]|uniref:amidohydrolase n=1 Tax=Pseudarthrobacter sp. O4 TaxID=3418417 RepID=UPI003CF63B93